MIDLEIDNLTLLLLASIVILLLYNRFSKPSPLVHPLLLGKQSEVSPVRQPGESGVYRSFATGHGAPLMVRPAGTLKTVRDVVSLPKAQNVIPRQRMISGTPLTDEALHVLLKILPLGLSTLFPSLSHPCPILVLLPSTPQDSLPLLLLSLSASPSHPLIILKDPLHLIPALTSKKHDMPGLVIIHDSLASDLIEQVSELEKKKDIGVLIVGGNGVERDVLEAAGKRGIRVKLWDEVWEAGENAKDEEEGSAPQPNDVHSYFYSSDNAGGEPRVTRFTHLNFTAGIAGLLSIFPADKRPNGFKEDVVASCEPLSNPLGMTIALASIWSGASFHFVGPSTPQWASRNHDTDRQLSDLAKLNSPKPTILFLKPTYHLTLINKLYSKFNSHPLGNIASTSKLASIAAGHISRNTIWDKLVWDSMRSSVLGGLAGDRLRSMIVITDPNSSVTENTLSWSNLLLSLPTSRILSSPSSTSPSLASHYYDLQSPSLDMTNPPNSQSGPIAHTGAPTSNIEVLLRSVDDALLEKSEKNALDQKDGQDGMSGCGSEEAIKGRLWVRGPALGEAISEEKKEDGWIDTGYQAAVRTNGTFSLQ